MFQQIAFDSSTGYTNLSSVAGSMQPEHKTSERSQPEITIQYLSVINHYVNAIFIHSDLGRDQGLSIELRD